MGNTMDATSAQMVLDLATNTTENTADTNIWAAANMYKILTSEGTTKNVVEQTLAVYKQLGYVPGAIVQCKWSGQIGHIKGMNTSTRWWYPGDRYPVYITLPNGATFEYSLFSEHYQDVASYCGKEKELLQDYGDDLQWSIVDNLENSDAVLDKQREIWDLEVRDGLLDYLETNFPTAPTQHDYAYAYGIYRLKNARRSDLHANNKNPIAFQKAICFFNSPARDAISNKELKSMLIQNFMDVFRGEWFDQENRVKYNIPTDIVFNTYKEMKDHHFKVQLKAILKERISKLWDNDLYAFSTMVKEDRELEDLSIQEIEKRIS